MRKHLILLCLSSLFYAQQTPEIKTDLPTITPPSPTVSALMKFEEVSVNAYTGIPDISLPLINIPTNSKDLNLDISLKYHPANVKGDNVAGDVGLGWSLFAGGSVSRTVRGLPDEIYVPGTSNGTIPAKIGLYHENPGDFNNFYYEKIGNLPQFAYSQPHDTNKYYWEIVEKNKFDTEHDLWQFNFMGYSGRFYIKKNEEGTLQVYPLSDHRIKIINHYTTVGNNSYVPTGFTLYDEKGYKYTFNVFETTVNKQAVENRHLLNPSSSISADKEFRSAFHLSEVIDPNNKVVLSYTYSDDQFREFSTSSNFIQNENFDGADLQMSSKLNCFNEFQPPQQIINNISTVKVKKITSIVSSDHGKILLGYDTNRTDTNIILTGTVPNLKELTLKDFNDVVVKKVKLLYDYSHILESRLILKEIVEEIGTSPQHLKYTFSYNKNDQNLNGTLGLDYWGYVNLIKDNCNSESISVKRTTTPSTSTFDLLNKIKYPTGGSSIFVFESNRYSYIGDSPVTDYSENVMNEEYLGSDQKTFNNSAYQYLSVYHKDRRAVFSTDIVHSQDQNTWDRTIRLFKVINGQYISVSGFHCIEPNFNCCKEINLEMGVLYALRRDNLSTTNNATDHLSITYYTKNDSQKQYLFGGGNRINKIGHFSIDNANIYEGYLNNTIVPDKEKKYSYNWIDNDNKSSGSLSFIKPVFNYPRIVKIATKCPEPPFYWGGSSAVMMSINYTTVTSLNNTPLVNTHGSDIGYKYVKIFETDKGVKEQKFTSPIDYPEEILIANTRPFLPSKNIDYKRGLLEKEIIRDNTMRVISENSFDYEFDEYEDVYGHRFFKADGIGFEGSYFNSYENYEYILSSYSGPLTCSSCGFNSFTTANLSGYPMEYTHAVALKDAHGWAKLSSKNTKNYFYNGASQKKSQTSETFLYNPLNKKISEHTVTNEEGIEIKNKYFYHTGNSTYSQNRISEIEKIESFENGELLNTKKVIYNNNWAGNASYLPYQIQTALGTDNLKTNVTFDQYDSKGNLLQYRGKDNIPVTIIWGYNNTQPIAKIEGVLYDNIKNNSLITAIINASNSDAANPATESSLITALDAVRNDVNFKDFQMATFTYDPLIGVTTLTPPSGIREIYKYDSANRLEKIVDEEGKILKENTYNYKP